MYDSIYCTLSEETVAVIKHLFETTMETKMQLVTKKKQTGSQDCGIFAIAVLTALLNEFESQK